jgi:peptidoglycan/LPS O-acetylase OafA/YrhL
MRINLNRYKGLDGLRGMAALLVAMYHLPKWSPVFDIGLINNGGMMVRFFLYYLALSFTITTQRKL